MDEQKSNGIRDNWFRAFCKGCKAESVFKKVFIATGVGEKFEQVYMCTGDLVNGVRRLGCGAKLKEKP